MSKCKPHPDIEDVEDVHRYCINNTFVWDRHQDGSVLSVFVCSGVHEAGGHVFGVRYSEQGNLNTRRDELLPFSSFLDLDKGPFKSHMVEWDDSLIYFTNNNPGGRAHGYTDHTSYKCFFQPYQVRLDNMHTIQRAFVALSYKRTKFSEGIRKLQDGECVGIALSDRFGVITTDADELPQLVYKTNIIGEVRDERPILLPQFEYLGSVINGLCNK